MPFDREQLGSVIPDEYAQYRALVVEALLFFLENLPSHRRQQILQEQARLPREASVEQRLVALAHHCPTLHKLGQVLARDRRLSESFRLRLQTLESVTPRSLDPELRRLLDDHVRHCGLGEIQLGAAPLAEASVSVVVPFLHVGRTPCPAGTAGVFKVLKPDIEQVLEEELEILARLGDWLSTRCETLCIPPLDYGDVFARVGDLLRMEIRLDQEQRHLEEAFEFYRPQLGVRIPRLFPFCTPRITAMERISGGKVTSPRSNGRGSRRDMASQLVEALLAAPMWSDVENAPFHADPHAGNLFWTDDDKLAILDWSLVGRLSKQVRVCITQVLLSAALSDHVRLCENVARLSERPPDPRQLAPVVSESLQRLRDGGRLGMHWLTNLLDAVVARTKMSFSGDLTLYRKMLHTLDGVLLDVAPQCCPDWELVRSFAGRWCWEWPARFVAPAWSREFPTHLSTADVASALWALAWQSPSPPR